MASGERVLIDCVGFIPMGSVLHASRFLIADI